MRDSNSSANADDRSLSALTKEFGAWSTSNGRSLTSTGAVRTFLRLAYGTHLAQVAELVDALVSGTSGAIRGGSSPLLGTITRIPLFFNNLLPDRAPYAGGAEKTLIRHAHEITPRVLGGVQGRVGTRNHFIERASMPLAGREARAHAHTQSGTRGG